MKRAPNICERLDQCVQSNRSEVARRRAVILPPAHIDRELESVNLAPVAFPGFFNDVLSNDGWYEEAPLSATHENASVLQELDELQLKLVIIERARLERDDGARSCVFLRVLDPGIVVIIEENPQAL